MAARLPMVLLACLAFAAEAEAARTGLVCMAPTRPADAGQPLSRLDEIEFYLDDGNPMTAYTAPFVLLSAGTNTEGHAVNTYAVSGAKTAGASIVFVGETPLVFELAEIERKVITLRSDPDETASMADAIPGIACWRVELEGGS